MSIPLTGTGGLFTRIGEIGALIYRENINQNTLHTYFGDLAAQYTGDTDLLSGITPNTVAFSQIPTSMTQALNTLAGNTILRMVFNDVPAQSTNLTNALKEVIRQMAAGSATVNRCALTASAAAQSGIHGDGVLVATVLGGNGLPLENLVAEALALTCSSDAQTGRAILGNEAFTILGQPCGNDPTWYQWPQGSAASGTLNAVSALSNAGANNLLSNGSFGTFVSNVPSQWTPTVGTAGTDFKASSTAYSGPSSLQLVGDAGGTGVLAAMNQLFGSAAAGTAQTLAPQTAYGFSLRVRADVVPAGGVIAIELIGGATTGSMSLLTDAQGNNCQLLFSLSALAANNTWYAESGTLRTPVVLLAVYALQIRVSTAISTGTNIFLGHLAMATHTSLYPGGPAVVLFSGASPFIQGDRIVLTTTNDRAGSTYGATFQTLFDRLFNMPAPAGGLLLPSVSGGAGTIADSLITS